MESYLLGIDFLCPFSRVNDYWWIEGNTVSICYCCPAIDWCNIFAYSVSDKNVERKRLLERRENKSSGTIKFPNFIGNAFQNFCFLITLM